MDHTQTRDGGDGAADIGNLAADDLLGIDVVPDRAGAVVVVAPAGEIDLLTAPVLRAALLSCLRPPCAQVIVDLAGVTFLNSAGLTVLAEAHHLAQAEGIDLGVRGGSRPVLRPMQVTGLWKLLAAPPGG